MAASSKTATCSLRLLVDKEKNRVVWAEVGKDFINVLFSFLVLPMGTIVRLLEKQKKSDTLVVGSIGNLYRSVSAIGIDYFWNEACMDRLLFPQNPMEDQCRRLKINVDSTTKAIKYFVCPSSASTKSCARLYSNATSKCSCGKLMTREIIVSEEDRVAGSVFFSKHTSFIVTDDMNVSINSLELVLKTLERLGYAEVDKLVDVFLDVGQQEVLSLLECLFTSDTPLTDAFLRKQSSNIITRTYQMLSPLVKKHGDRAAEPEAAVTLNVYFRKQDCKILYFECGDDLVDLLFTFLGFPFSSVLQNVGDGIILGCIGNLYRSFKDLSSKNWTGATLQPLRLYRYFLTKTSYHEEYGFTRNCNKHLVYSWDKLEPLQKISL